MTQYTIFMHYYNDKIGNAVTNTTKCKWNDALMTIGKYNNNDDTSDPNKQRYLALSDIDKNKIKNGQECLETIYISSTKPDTAENTRVYEEYVLTSTDIGNPKYDMLFIYNGLGYYNYKQQKDCDTGDTKFLEQTQLYFDKMKRVQLKPWFFHSTYHSLKSAMSKAETLVNLFGKNNILIGKEIDLSQYIDIV